MEVINPYLGKYSGSSVFLNHGKYGPYLNHDSKLYSVPQCFQKPTFKLSDAIKIIEFRKKWFEQQKENKKDFKEESIFEKLDKEPKGATSDDDDEIKPCPRIKVSKKKF